MAKRPRKRQHKSQQTRRFWLYENVDGSQYIPKDTKPFEEVRTVIGTLEHPNADTDEYKRQFSEQFTIELSDNAEHVESDIVMLEIHTETETYFVENNGLAYVKDLPESVIEQWFDVRVLRGKVKIDSIRHRAKMQAQNAYAEARGEMPDIDARAIEAQQRDLIEHALAVAAWSFTDDDGKPIAICAESFGLLWSWQVDLIQVAIAKVNNPPPNWLAA